MGKNNQNKCLILGGSHFIGKAFLTKWLECSPFQNYLANRGQKKNPFPQLTHLKIDRLSEPACTILKNYDFDLVVDFSCWTLPMLESVINQFSNNPYYVFLSSGLAECSKKNHPDYEYGVHKANCEALLKERFAKTLIIRSSYVMGLDDYTNRFDKDPKTDVYYHKGTKELVTQYIDVTILATSLINLIIHQQTGLVKMGYV